MSFAVPTALMLAALAAPIIALYILKVRLRRIPVSTNLFWKQVYDEKPPRSLWQNLRHLMSLLAQLLLLLLLVFAIADPYFSWQALQARRLVIVMDTSASMRTSDVAPSRFEAARKAAHQVLDGLRSRDQVAIVSAGSRPEVVLGMAGHVPTLRRAIDSIELTDAASSLDASIELAKQLIGDHEHGQVLVLTDGCAQRPDPDAKLTSLAPLVTAADKEASAGAIVTDEILQGNPSSAENAESSANRNRDADAKPIDIQYQTFATAAGNVGITQFQARRSLVDPIGYEILVKVGNASDRIVKARLELELDEIPIDVIPLTLQPEETWTRVVEKTSLEGGELKASLVQIRDAAVNDDDSSQPATVVGEPSNLNGLTTDDIAWAIVPRRVVQNVLIVSPGNLFLQKVFEANPLVNVTVRSDLPEQWPSDTIVVCHRLVPETLPSGDLLVIDPESGCNAWDLGELIENPIVTDQDEDSPLLTHIRLDNVVMPETHRLDFKTSFKSLAQTVTGESIYAAIYRPQGDCLVLSVNLERSDLAFRTAFPILITNALSWFAGQPGELEPSIAAGQMTRLTTVDDSFQSPDSVAETAVTETAVTVTTVTETAAQETAAQETMQADASTDGPGEEAVVQTAAAVEALPKRHRFLISPSSNAAPLLSNQVGPLSEVGLWSVIEKATPSDVAIATQPSDTDSDQLSSDKLVQRIAVNLANANETDLRPWEGTQSNQNSPLVSGSWFTRPIWFYLIVTALLLSTLEWFLYQRRFIS